ncbi:MAG: hypothetical protein A2148_08180 [Chloroflexi bacterium RBG_16_68_14]|nr:MAG: hypothetical protein A2148_08180 [Chloroflexi bacterium RBG_16_68_14]
MTARILVGTCSWADKTLVECGRFYPPQLKTAEERLRFYADEFPLVEVDSSYYGLPSERNAALWVERTPPHFTFDVKAFRLMTQHPTPPSTLPKDLRETLPAPLREKPNLYPRDLPREVVDEVWQRFESALLPLDSAGKLGVVVLQFPPWFLPGPENRDYLLEAQARLPQYRIAVEFRNGRWLSERNAERTFRFLRDHRLPFVCVDEPQGFPNSVPPLAEATADIALVRFHGRNAATWAQRGLSPAERFDWLYSEEELREWVPRVEGLARETREVHLLMNNCREDKAVLGARQLQLLLHLPERGG